MANQTSKGEDTTQKRHIWRKWKCHVGSAKLTAPIIDAGKMGWCIFLVRCCNAILEGAGNCFAPELQLSILDFTFRTPRFNFVCEDPMRVRR